MTNEQFEAAVLGDAACQRSPIVVGYLQNYRAGDCTLHEAILYALLETCRQNARLMDECVRLSMMQPQVIHLTAPAPDGVTP